MTENPAAAQKTVVHLVRHGEVENPRGVLYGRLPGYHLSSAGQQMAKAAADWLAGRDVRLLMTSPMERAQETAGPIAAEFGLVPETDDRLIEAWNHFEGMAFGAGDGSLRRVRHWPHLVNPLRPSWGEPYREVADRMLAAAADAARSAAGHEAVCVSHQLPIWTVRRAAEHHRLWHHPGRRQCALGSVTSLTYTGGTITAVSYAEPSAPATRGLGGA